jgi:hypothetical protein
VRTVEIRAGSDVVPNSPHLERSGPFQAESGE